MIFGKTLIRHWASRSASLPDASGREAGLTLVEMIVVLAIIALVAALIVPNVIGRPDQARVTVASTDIKTITAALKMYRLDNGSYPSTEQGLGALAVRPSTPPIPSNWPSEGYLEQVPMDPWGRAYIFHNEDGRISVLSYGKDGKAGGDGLDADIGGPSR